MLKQFREDGFIADVLAPNNSAFRKVYGIPRVRGF